MSLILCVLKTQWKNQSSVSFLVAKCYDTSINWLPWNWCQCGGSGVKNIAFERRNQTFKRQLYTFVSILEFPTSWLHFIYLVVFNIINLTIYNVCFSYYIYHQYILGLSVYNKIIQGQNGMGNILSSSRFSLETIIYNSSLSLILQRNFFCLC